MSLSTSESSVLLQPEDVPVVVTSIVHPGNCFVEELVRRGALTTIMKRELFSCHFQQISVFL